MKKTILIIDDDYHTTRFLAKRLRTRNYEVIVANEGDQGVQKAKDKLPDLILLDMKMPRLNGIEVFEELRQLDTTNQIPVIFMAAHPTLEIRKLVLKMGGKEIITKPFLSKDLELIIEGIIDGYDFNGENRNIDQYSHDHISN